MAAKALLDEEPNPSEQRVRHWLAGNLCRCTGYDKIVRAVLDAAGKLEAKGMTKSNVVLSTQKYKVVGTRPIRHDGTDKVTGRARYGADFHPLGLLHGKILRSPHAHARIKSIEHEPCPGPAWSEGPWPHRRDLPKISGLSSDLAEGQYVNYWFMSNNVLAADKVLYKGHAVAAVAATSPHIAEEALALINVEYEVLPAVI